MDSLIDPALLALDNPERAENQADLDTTAASNSTTNGLIGSALLLHTPEQAIALERLNSHTRPALKRYIDYKPRERNFYDSVYSSQHVYEVLPYEYTTT